MINALEQRRQTWFINAREELQRDEVKPSQAKPSQAKPSQVKPSQVKSSQVKSSQAKSSQTKPSRAKPSQIKESQAKSKKIKPSQAKPSQVKPNQRKSSHVKPSQVKSSQAKSSQVKPSQVKTSQVQPVRESQATSSREELLRNVLVDLLPECVSGEHWDCVLEASTLNRATIHCEVVVGEEFSLPRTRSRETISVLRRDASRPWRAIRAMGLRGGESEA